MDPDSLFDLGIWLLVGALLGSRALYVIAEWEQYSQTPWEALLFYKGGLVFYGGVLGAVPVGLWFVRKKQMPTWFVADITAPSVAIGHALGRVGCFLNGCCFGHPTESAFGVVFSPHSSAWEYLETVYGKGPIAVHPVQLYEAVGEGFIFLLLLLADRKKRFHGQTFAVYLLLYGILRLALEELREGSPEILMGLTGSQWISIAAIGSSLALIFFLRRRGETSL